jgi:hypothetical protein
LAERVVEMIASRGGDAATGPVALIVASLVVFGLVPSLLVLHMCLQASETPGAASPWLQVFQVLLFIGAVGMYLLLGTVGEMWRRQRSTN